MIPPSQELWIRFAIFGARRMCDDPSGVLIPSTTRYSQLYKVEQLHGVGYAEVEYFCYSEWVIRGRIFLLFQVGYTE